MHVQGFPKWSYSDFMYRLKKKQITDLYELKKSHTKQ